MASLETMELLTFTLLFFLGVVHVRTVTIPLPSFSKLKANYPGYRHHGGQYHNHRFIRMTGINDSILLHDMSVLNKKKVTLVNDTSALRLSYALNRIGGKHSLGRELVRLSKFGHDSLPGQDGLQYIYHPIAYGPFLADKYGYPSVTKLHQFDPTNTKMNFWGKQGIVRVITYTKIENRPKGHVGLWDCNHFHQSKDWIAGHSLISVEFWESPDSHCSHMDTKHYPRHLVLSHQPTKPPEDFKTLIRHKSWRRRFIKKYYLQSPQERNFW